MTEHKRPIVEVVALTEGWQCDNLANLRLVLGITEGRCERAFAVSRAQPVASNRNGIVKRFLVGDADYLLMLDHDQMFHPQQNPLDYVFEDLDVVGFPTPLWKPDRSPTNPIRWNVWLEDGEGNRTSGTLEEGAGLVECAAVGTGAILIARRVFEHPDLRAPFLDEWDEDGIRTRGEDLTFCERARAAGFRVYAAMDMPCGHLKEVNLLHMMRLMNEMHRSHRRPLMPMRNAFTGKRLAFVVSPGRCGTKYLAQALDQIDGVTALHEPEPGFHHTLRSVQLDRAEGLRFWINEKLPTISAVDTPVYVETAHCFCEGYAEHLLDLDIVPDLVVLRRPFREVALSMWRRRAIPGWTELGKTHHVGPTDPTVWPIIHDAGQWTDYQICYWYTLEMERRAQLYAEMYRKRGVRVHETTLWEIATREGMDALTDALRLGHVPELPGVVNANQAAITGRIPGDTDTLELQELEVREAMK